MSGVGTGLLQEKLAAAESRVADLTNQLSQLQMEKVTRPPRQDRAGLRILAAFPEHRSFPRLLWGDRWCRAPWHLALHLSGLLRVDAGCGCAQRHWSG